MNLQVNIKATDEPPSSRHAEPTRNHRTALTRHIPWIAYFIRACINHSIKNCYQRIPQIHFTSLF